MANSTNKTLKNSLRLEELGLFALALLAFSHLDYSWGLFALFFLAPDLSALGYFINPHIGSFTYNLVHHKATAIILYLFGLWQGVPALQFAGLVLFAHSSLDRVFGYGLKLPGAFDQTHLGSIGRAKREAQP